MVVLALGIVLGVFLVGLRLDWGYGLLGGVGLGMYQCRVLLLWISSVKRLSNTHDAMVSYF